MTLRPASGSPAGSTAGAAGLVVFGLFVQEIGAAVAVLVFPRTGPAGMVLLRLFFSAVFLLALSRPTLRGITRANWAAAALFGVSISVMNLLFYAALASIPLGAAVTFEILGPLVLSVVLARRAAAWLWALLAAAGVVMLGSGGLGQLTVPGVLFALGAGAMWAAYILASRRVGAAFSGLQGLAIAMAFGTVLALPLGIGQAGSAVLDPAVLALGAVVALFSSTVPYAVELLALRRMPAAAFSVLIALAPAVATLTGAVLLAQHVGWLESAGVALVVVAAMGALRSPAR